jgi:hypothetical protein
MSTITIIKNINGLKFSATADVTEDGAVDDIQASIVDDQGYDADIDCESIILHSVCGSVQNVSIKEALEEAIYYKYLGDNWL